MACPLDRTPNQLPGAPASSVTLSGGDGAMELVAYPVTEPLLRIVPAAASRQWMEDTRDAVTERRYAMRCLPLVLANQSGWMLLNSHRFFVVWTGGVEPCDLKIVYQQGEEPFPARSHFGNGILTFNIPYLFRTPPGFNLQARGPANSPKDGAYPLEGIIETDWADATFTMNWKITRPKVPIIFGVGEPICMLVPQRRGDLEQVVPSIREIDSEPELEDRYRQFFAARRRFQAETRIEGSEARRQRWQRDYFLGRSVSGYVAAEHQTRLHLRDFADQRPAASSEQLAPSE
jgi:hypothetical protein